MPKGAGLIIEKMNEYLKYITSLYPEEKKSVVVTGKEIRRRYTSYRGRIASGIIKKMMTLEIAETFSEGGRNPYYKINLEKARKYLKDYTGKE